MESTHHQTSPLAAGDYSPPLKSQIIEEINLTEDLPDEEELNFKSFANPAQHIYNHQYDSSFGYRESNLGIDSSRSLAPPPPYDSNLYHQQRAKQGNRGRGRASGGFGSSEFGSIDRQTTADNMIGQR